MQRAQYPSIKQGMLLEIVTSRPLFSAPPIKAYTSLQFFSRRKEDEEVFRGPTGDAGSFCQRWSPADCFGPETGCHGSCLRSGNSQGLETLNHKLPDFDSLLLGFIGLIIFCSARMFCGFWFRIYVASIRASPVAIYCMFWACR